MFFFLCLLFFFYFLDFFLIFHFFKNFFSFFLLSSFFFLLSSCGMCNTGFAHDVPHAKPPPTAGRPKMPGSTVDMNQEGSYVGEEMQSNTVEYPRRRGVMAPTGSCEPCRFADNCWRPLCPFTHPGNGRFKKWAAIWNLLAELEDDPHVERTSGDGEDFINATTVAAEPFDIDGVSETVWDQSSGHEIGRHGVTEVDPPGQGGCAACETDGNGNETNFALGLTQDGPPGILSHDEMEVDSTLGGSLGNRSYNVAKANVTQNALPGDHSHSETNSNAIHDAPPGNHSHSETDVNAIQSVLPGSQSHDKTNVNATLGEPPGNLSHNEMNANATQGALPGSQSHDGTNVDATQGSPPGNSDRTRKKNKKLLLRKREEQLVQQA